MKKALFFLMIIISPFIFSSCLLLALFVGTDSLDKHECMTPETLTNLVNRQITETTFTLVDSDYIKRDDFKARIVYLSTEDLPGKTISAIQIYSWPSPSSDVEIAAELFDQRKKDRTTIVHYDDYYFTDYYFYKYENEIYTAFEKLYSPLTTGLEKNEWKLAVKPEISTFRFNYPNDSKYKENKKYSSAKTLLQTSMYDCYLFLNKDFSAEVQSDYNSFMNDLNTIYQGDFWYFDWYDGWNDEDSDESYSDPISDADTSKKERDTPYARLQCYYSTSLPASEVTEKELTAETFIYKQGVVVAK